MTKIDFFPLLDGVLPMVLKLLKRRILNCQQASNNIQLFIDSFCDKEFTGPKNFESSILNNEVSELLKVVLAKYVGSFEVTFPVKAEEDKVVSLLQSENESLEKQVEKITVDIKIVEGVLNKLFEDLTGVHVDDITLESLQNRMGTLNKVNRENSKLKKEIERYKNKEKNEASISEFAYDMQIKELQQEIVIVGQEKTYLTQQVKKLQLEKKNLSDLYKSEISELKEILHALQNSN